MDLMEYTRNHRKDVTMSRRLLIPLFALPLVLAACGGPAPAENQIQGDAARGEALFAQTTIGSNNAPGCITCHSLEAGVMLVGPSQADVGARAETAVSGQSASEYLRTAIVDPNAHIVDGFVAGVMYQNYAQDLSEQEIADLVAYMLTLR